MIDHEVAQKLRLATIQAALADIRAIADIVAAGIDTGDWMLVTHACVELSEAARAIRMGARDLYSADKALECITTGKDSYDEADRDRVRRDMEREVADAVDRFDRAMEDRGVDERIEELTRYFAEQTGTPSEQVERELVEIAEQRRANGS